MQEPVPACKVVRLTGSLCRESSSSLIVCQQVVKLVLQKVDLPVAAVCELVVDVGSLGKHHFNLGIL